MNKPNPNAETLEEMIRVDHAGEYGANRIYEGQLKILGKTDIAPTLRHMLAQEQEHLDTFNKLIVSHKVRPSALMPFWHVGALALGVGSALLGKKAAMACTVAVEEVIDEHYQSQLDHIADPALRQTVERFRQEEVEHRDIGLHNGAEDMKGYELFKGLVKTISKTAIFLAKRI